MMIPVLLVVLAGQADTSVAHLPSRIAHDVGRLGTRRPIFTIAAGGLAKGIVVQGLKYATHRTRPNGGHRSFPSGHAASGFTTAEVLRRHHGWKVGLAAYVGAAYIATSRLSEREHYLTDVVFGAAIGIAAARTPGQTR
jgi:membrane-associated phospholipid phosphatase